ncbi:MAG TPA: type I restriction endonuclease subunit M [Arcobacter sp.]|nr:type I restriction endonuclease subunit M [Arcobacter sp.]
MVLIYTKKFSEFNTELKVDLKNEKLIYPEKDGLTISQKQTCNFSDNENFVVFECVHRLLNQGYNPKHIELEQTYSKIKKEDGGGRADIIVKDNDDKVLLIIECKTYGTAFDSHWKKTLQDGDQLFRYITNKRETQFLCMYASSFIDNEIKYPYRLISLNDNEKYLENNIDLLSFKEAKTQNKEDIFKAWSDTYKSYYATIGLFEDTQAYKIGKDKYTVKDLKSISSKDIQSKYHEFATILRQHNVSGRENAFDKLVNLFLCKVTDEKENPDNLKFYYKGISYDEPFDFQDRLQLLYKQGMDKFLDDDITYIDNNLIDEAFGIFKDKPNETKRLIKQYLKEQKFFTNNDFAFIDVHNEKLFYQNFEVLLKISRMIQDISLTASDENQFLGDMFEGFLDQGVKQSEGQFFTPMPIVKFIINSMPKLDEPKVIDYACGSGHFLNEYISVDNKAKITGIEKEYRLSKVAKVSSFMYGSDIDIIYSDALSTNDKIKNNSYDVIIANPPYSVKGFLETLADEDRHKYDLIKEIDEKSYSKNGSIECFFIERAKQLLKTDGIAGIVLPNSILSKDTPKIYIKTREIILKYFDIVAIADFGSGTFGKTGTNTATLFLRRKAVSPDISEHLKDMVNSWFECDFETNKSFKDENILKEYCHHIKIDFDLYKTILCKNIDEKIYKNETFSEYKVSFEKLTETKNRKKRAYYKNLSIEEKNDLESKELLKYIVEIERDKVYYFGLAHKNKNDVVIIKSPSDNKENKKFLGYDWSSSKGKEGIQYLANSTLNDDTLSEDDKRVLENLSGLKNINTPLYNPHDKDDETKINSLISKNFNNEEFEIPQELKQFVSKAKLVDMLDFTRKDFNKGINLVPKKEISLLSSKFPNIDLDTLLQKIKGNTTKITKDEIQEVGKFPVITQEQNNLIAGYTNINTTITDLPLVMFGDHSCTFKFIDFPFIRGADGTQLLKFDENKILTKYFYHLSNILEITNKDKYERHMKYLKSNKIPVPPLTIQKNIIKECKIIDESIDKANTNIEDLNSKIEEEIKQSKGTPTKLINITSKIGSGSTPKGGEKSYKESGITLIRSQNIYDSEFHKEGLVFIDDIQAKKLDIVTIKENDVLFNITGASVARCCIVEKIYLPARVNQHVAIIRPIIEKVLPKYLQKILISKGIKKELVTMSETSLSREAITKVQLEDFKIPLPSIEIQKEIVEKIDKLEIEINKAQKVIDGASDKKKEILRKYL